MAINKRLMGVGAADTNLPSEYFNTVLYTGNGGTQRIGGYINRGGVFNGSSSRIMGAPAVDNRNSKEYSVSLWFNTTSTNESCLFGGIEDTTQDPVFKIVLRTDGHIDLEHRSNVSSTINTIQGTTNFSDGSWHHVVAWIDNDQIALYVDGNTQPNSPLSLTDSGNCFVTSPAIGADNRRGTLTQFFNGTIDQVRVFDKALSSSEVTTLYGETYESTTISTTDIFSDGSGVALYQLDGNANDTGGVNGKFGAAAIFNGSSSHIDLPSPIPYTNTDMTFSCWVKLNSAFSSGFQTIIGAGNKSTGEGIIRLLVRYNSANSYKIEPLRAYSGNSYYTASSNYSAQTINAGSWYNIVYTYSASGSTAKIYINGSLVSTTSLTTPSTDSTNSGVLALGQYRDGTGSAYFWNGLIDEVRIYTDVLTSTEVGYLYNNTTASIPTDNLEAYYKLDGNALDSANSFDGTESNITYGFDGTASNVVYQEATNFTPDLVWIKNRDTTSDQVVFDSVRGVQERIFPNETYQESNSSTSLTSFDSNGFTVGSDANINANNNDIVAWCFNAGTVAAASNTNGTITSTVKANQDAGFSIVEASLPTNGATNGDTFGHGLDTQPELIIQKATSISLNWYIFSEYGGSLLGNNNVLKFTTAAATSDSLFDITPTTFKVGSTNTAHDFIAYCFHSVDGIQKVGKYTGTGATGNLVETSFEPAFVMIKETGNAGSWHIYDNERPDSGGSNRAYLLADTSNYENEFGAFPVSFKSNGFSVDNTGNGTNRNEGNYIYLAIAADPDTTTPVVENSFDVVTYTGSGGTQSIDTAFKPDLIWVKNRDVAVNNYLYDSIRGTGAAKALHSNTTDSESSASTYSVNGGVQSIDSNGFTVFEGTDGTYQGTNKSGNDYVAWVFKAGDHDDNLPQINTEGDIDSIVSVNDEAGFSIVKWTGDGVSSATVGHGLSSPPEMIIAKSISEVNDWNVNHVGIPNKIIYLHSTNAAFSGGGTNGAFGYQSTNTATTFQFTAGSSGVNNVNKNGQQYIAYCFTSVTGYQKIGSYTGGGLTKAITGVGFKPDFVMIKCTSDLGSNQSYGSWVMHDSSRNMTGDETTNPLFANRSYQEGLRGNGSSGSGVLDLTFNSDGFTIEHNGYEANGSGEDYIYLAIKAN